MKNIFLGIITLCGGVLFSDTSKAEVFLVGHRAEYELQSIMVDADSGILDAGGTLMVDYHRGCVGWQGVSDLDLELVLGGSEGGGLMHFESVDNFFERFDGSGMNFYSTEDIDGVEVSSIRGRAERASLVGGGKESLEVEFSEPRGLVRHLPERVFLPMAQTEKLINAAIEGQNFLQTKMFNGTVESDYYIYSSLIGEEIAAGEFEDWKFGGEASPRGWRMHHAIFMPDDSALEPEFEIEMTLLENGVMGAFIADYDDYKLEGKLVSLEIYPIADCKN